MTKRSRLWPALAVAIILAGAPFARAQQGYGTFGTDQNGCDRGALAQILSTSRGNLVGSAAGAALGGLLGNQVGKGGGKTLATIAGVLGGAVAGGYIGRQMDPADQACVGQTLQNTPTNQTVGWHNPDNDSSYWVTPTRTFRSAQGEDCREYVTQAVIEGRRQDTRETACRQPDGNWRVMPVNSEARAPIEAPPYGREAPPAYEPDPRYGAPDRYDRGYSGSTPPPAGYDRR
jgi:surface antigen